MLKHAPQAILAARTLRRADAAPPKDRLIASPADIAERYFQAVRRRDLDAMVACWAPGGVERLVGQAELIAPGGVREYFAALFAAFPDFASEVVDVTSGGDRAVVRWRACATFAGPGHFQGFAPNGARIEIEGCDVLTVDGDLIRRNDVYLDSGAIARQLGFLPPAGSPAEARLARLANLRTKLRERVEGAAVEPVAAGVWIVRGGFPVRAMNVYLIESEGGVIVFDAGISAMASALRAIGARMGGISRVVLGHADPDHRGAAPALGAPVYCHPAEREAAESPEPRRPYWHLERLGVHGRAWLPLAVRAWDGGAVPIAGTVQEGEVIGGFRVVELPGHAPGQIGLFRESDRLALVSDCFYTLDPQTGLKRPPQVPHPAFNEDTERARESIRKLAALEPASAWPGHADPVRRDVRSALERAASS